MAISRSRRARGISQSDLATAAGVGRVTVVRVERGHPGLSLAHLAQILSALDPTLVEQLVGAVENDRQGANEAFERLPARAPAATAW